MTKKWTIEEKQSLEQWLNNNYEGEGLPNYDNAADFINQIYKNNRTPSSCKAMDIKINKQNKTK